MKRILSVFAGLAAVVLIADPALAETGQSVAASPASAKIWYFIAIVVTSGLSMGVASSFCALGQSRAIATACEGIARQPSASGKVQTAMIIGLALIESLAIYVLLIALLLFFANPFTQSVVDIV